MQRHPDAGVLQIHSFVSTVVQSMLAPSGYVCRIPRVVKGQAVAILGDQLAGHHTLGKSDAAE